MPVILPREEKNAYDDGFSPEHALGLSGDSARTTDNARQASLEESSRAMVPPTLDPLRKAHSLVFSNANPDAAPGNP